VFTADQIQQHVRDIDPGPPWAMLKEIAERCRADRDYAETVLGKLPGKDTPVTAYNGGTADADNYIIGGMFHAACIATEIAQVHDTEKTLDVLDFGFGAARIIRHLSRFWPQHRYHAAEVNAATLEHLNEVCPEVDGRHINPFPPSPFESESMDVVYAWSIWTHFNEVQARAWLEDVHRILRPGGCALITVHSESLVERYGTDPQFEERRKRRGADFDAVMKTYRETGFSFFPVYPDSAADVGIDVDTFGMAFVSHQYVSEAWGDLFEFRSVFTAVPEWQDGVVLVKR